MATNLATKRAILDAEKLEQLPKQGHINPAGYALDQSITASRFCTLRNRRRGPCGVLKFMRRSWPSLKAYLSAVYAASVAHRLRAGMEGALNLVRPGGPARGPSQLA